MLALSFASATEMGTRLVQPGDSKLGDVGTDAAGDANIMTSSLTKPFLPCLRHSE